MMKVRVHVNDQKLQAMLGQFADKFAENLQTGLQRFALRLQARVKNKLSDDVLHVRTGTLRRSINQTVERTQSAVKASVGTNVEYAAVHEFGFHGTVNVRAHLRAIRKHGAFSKSGKWRKGKLTGDFAFVQAHTMKMNMPERSFLRSAMKELESLAIGEITKAAQDALKS